MDKKELNQLADMLAKKTADIVIKQLQEFHYPEASEMVDSNEAAKILGISSNYLRTIKDRFPHVKVGDNKQGRILFRRADLLVNYTK